VIAEPALQSALLRVQRRIELNDDAAEWRIREVRVATGEAGLLRSYDTLARSALEVNTSGGFADQRWGVTVSATAVASPDDGQNLRLDGSELSIRWGNWLFGVNQMDRWWGPGWDGSLILSTNARPMPALSFDRIQSTPFAFPVLRWLGPWRLSGFVSMADRHRADVDESLFLGMRVSFKPAHILEFGLSRSAQFCGRDRPCGFAAFRNVLLGNDNAGLRVDPEDEPGNQMAGMDMRIVSPFRSLPVALYAQFVGEDNSSSGIPERYLGLLGFETWNLLDSGSLLRTRLEYADTTCKFSSGGEGADCAYRQTIFFAGYRYHGRNIGHTTDADSESWALSLSLTAADGASWSLRLRRASLDRYGFFDAYNRVSGLDGESHSVEVGWNAELWGQALSAQIGAERNDVDPRGARTEAFGFLQWRKTL
jgi:hypothetical protein